MGWTNPDTGSEIEVDGDDVTVTFTMSLPPQPAEDDKEK